MGDYMRSQALFVLLQDGWVELSVCDAGPEINTPYSQTLLVKTYVTSLKRGRLSMGEQMSSGCLLCSLL